MNFKRDCDGKKRKEKNQRTVFAVRINIILAKTRKLSINIVVFGWLVVRVGVVLRTTVDDCD